MNVVINSPNSQISKNVDVFNTKEYQDFIDRVKFDIYKDYIKKTPGKTIKEISEHFGEKELHVKTVLSVWIKSWTTFFKMGRIVNKEDTYYCLSPRNPTIRCRNPKIYN